MNKKSISLVAITIVFIILLFYWHPFRIDIWTILGFITLLVLPIYSFGGRNAVWGGLTLGIFVGIFWALFLLLNNNAFEWAVVIKAGVVGTLIGFLFEFIGKSSQRYFQ